MLWIRCKLFYFFFVFTNNNQITIRNVCKNVLDVHIMILFIVRQNMGNGTSRAFVIVIAI